MKKLILILFLAATGAHAQSVDVKDVSAHDDTTIEIRKGHRGTDKWKITEGQDDIEGDAAPLIQTARANWKTACAEWKREVKELNQENSVIALNCGRMSCKSENMENTCRSTGKYKIKVRIQ